MSLLGALEISSLRAAAQSAMPGSCVIWRRTLTSDGVGGQSGSVAAVGTVACRLVQHDTNPSEQVRAGRVSVLQEWYVYVPAFTDIRPTSDYLVVSGAGLGGTFDVIGLHARGTAGYEPSRRVVCTERR